MATDPLLQAVSNGRRRLVGSILGYAEQELYPDLTPEQQRAFREKVLQSVGAFSDFVVDVTRGMSSGVWVNEDVLTLLSDISEQVRNSRDV